MVAEPVDDFTHPAPRLRVLLVEENAADCELILQELTRDGFDLTHEAVANAADFRWAIHIFAPEIILADYNLPQWRGMEAVDILNEERLDIPLILVSGALGEVTAVECIKCGASDYVLKGALSRLPISVRRALGEKRRRQERKRAEEELAEKVKQLAQSNAELEQFAYVASHDLQEPLRMIAAYNQLLADQYRGKLDAKADKYIQYAVDGSLRMQGLIHDLLEFSRCGRRDRNLQPTDCGIVVQTAVRNLEAAIQESKARLVFDSLPMVMADGSRLTRVFQNLIGNAIKFRGNSTPLIEITAEEKESEWDFSVSDNGIGIAAEYHEEVFEIFRRLHTREEYAGNGIGLAICKKIIEQHSGRIWVESGDGQGSTFHLSLPLPPPSPSTSLAESWASRR